MQYDPLKVSKCIQNSIFYDKRWVKSWRLEWTSRSLEEAKTGFTKRWTKELWRIFIGLDDKDNLIILDGRHLLQAYNILYKPIPEEYLSFESPKAKELFIALYTQ